MQQLDGLERFDFIVAHGRAAIFPVYKGTYERAAPPWKRPPRDSSAYRDWVIQLSKDLGRTIDYLETRSDIQSDKLVYLGNSFGATMGAILPAIEQRISVCVLVIGGFHSAPFVPEVDPVNFAPRVTIPTLMLNGRYDFTFPVESSQNPMFERLGAPPEHKRHILYDAGHGVPADLYRDEVLAWLDKYLGPVK